MAKTPYRINPVKFQTEDGYTLYYIGQNELTLKGSWVDSLNPKEVDLSFHGDKQGPREDINGYPYQLISGNFYDACGEYYGCDAKCTQANPCDERKEVK